MIERQWSVRGGGNGCGARKALMYLLALSKRGTSTSASTDSATGDREDDADVSSGEPSLALVVTDSESRARANCSFMQPTLESIAVSGLDASMWRPLAGTAASCIASPANPDNVGQCGELAALGKPSTTAADVLLFEGERPPLTCAGARARAVHEDETFGELTLPGEHDLDRLVASLPPRCGEGGGGLVASAPGTGDPTGNRERGWPPTASVPLLLGGRLAPAKPGRRTAAALADWALFAEDLTWLDGRRPGARWLGRHWPGCL